jgi:hypothetical protein
MKYKLVTELSEGIKIYCDQLNWILEVRSKDNRSYFPYLELLLDELLDLHILKKASSTSQIGKDIKSLINVVQDAREATRKDIELIQKTLTSADIARKKGEFTKKIDG